MDRLDDGYLASLFAAGVLSAFRQAGGTEKDAEAFLGCALEKTARRRHYDDEDDDEDSTWWSRNKSWVLPTVLTTGAFLIGGDAGKHGRPDRSLWANAGSQLWKRVKALFGFSSDPMYKSLVSTKDWDKLNERMDSIPYATSIDGVLENHLINGDAYA